MPRKPRRRPDDTRQVLVQTRISRRAAALMKERAEADLRSDAGYLRRLIYRDLGLLEQDGDAS